MFKVVISNLYYLNCLVCILFILFHKADLLILLYHYIQKQCHNLFLSVPLLIKLNLYYYLLFFPYCVSEYSTRLKCLCFHKLQVLSAALFKLQTTSTRTWVISPNALIGINYRLLYAIHQAV